MISEIRRRKKTTSVKYKPFGIAMPGGLIDEDDDNVRNDYDGSEMKVFVRCYSVESPLKCIGTGTPFLADPLC